MIDLCVSSITIMAKCRLILMKSIDVTEQRSGVGIHIVSERVVKLKARCHAQCFLTFPALVAALPSILILLCLICSFCVLFAGSHIKWDESLSIHA